MIRQLTSARSFPAFFAVFLLVFANASHIHLRYCLDGGEAPVSIHFETEDSHKSYVATSDNLAEEDLADIESELSLDSLLAKISKAPTDFFAISNYALPAFTQQTRISTQLVEREVLPDSPETLLPPSRAPPVIA